MNKVLALIFVINLCFLSNKLFGQNVSNEGTDFWAVFPTHIPSGNSLANIAVFVTSKFNTEVTVSCGSWTETKAIPANTAVQFDVPRSQAYIYGPNDGTSRVSEANTVLTNRGIHIKVTDGKPKVSTYTHIYAGARSAASLILPYETLGQKYYSMNYTQSNGGDNFLTLIAVEDNTTLLLHELGGSTRTINLPKAGDVYEYIGGGYQDLTGVFIETDPTTSSCKRFAAFSGTSVVAIACTGTQDPLYQQLYPTASWGKNYGVVPFADRRYILRILAQEDNTTVTYNGRTIIINKGGFVESEQLFESTFVSADKLISVAQYALTEVCSSISGNLIIGDPDMVMLNPIEFNIKGVTVFSSTLQNIAVRYLNILIRANKSNTFKINGVIPSGVIWNTLTGNPNYAYAQIPVTASSLTLTADDGFNAIAYGFGKAESYAYSAGTNLSSNNYLTVINQARNEENQNGCIGQSLDFKISLPYKPDKITWKLDTDAAIETINPAPEVKTINGQISYTYRYPVNKTYTSIGEYHLEVNAHIPNNENNCISGDLTTNYIFAIYDLPTAAFDFATSACAKSDISFTDKSVSGTADLALTNWLWDFGDGSTPSTEQNPKHQYAGEGIYTVKLSTKSATGCYSDVVMKTIQIFPLPVSGFTSLANTCINTNYLLSDNSKISSLQSPNKIIKWSWDFGDGTKLDQADGLPFNYQYKAEGTYRISLITTSAEGCTSTAYIKSVIVTGLPEANFTMPDVCLNDISAVFINKSVNATGITGAITYAWDFGDPDATMQNPNTSSDKDGTHKYTRFGEYNVTLKITNANGCVSIKTQKFTVNGAVAKADFTVKNENDLCSNKAVVINNSSKAFFGKITKINIYKDFVNAPQDFTTIFYPTEDDIALVYPLFGGTLDKTFTIKLIAFSGENCSLEAIKIITIKPSPVLIFDDIPAVCQNDGSIIINQAKETSGFIGRGVYSGDGIDAQGNFNPKLVQAGQHLITYNYISDNTCSASISKTITVYNSPLADAGSTLYILAGGQVTIPAKAAGTGLRYKWSPSKGLDHDDVLNPTASPEEDANYQLLATTSEGCTVTTTILVKVLQQLMPPNSFTPNGDGVNDFWNIKYLESYPKATIEVFNRNGNRVFFSNGYKIPFDGNYKNEPLPVGVYYYIISPGNGRKAVTGPLTIIR